MISDGNLKKIFNFKKKYIDQILRTLDSRGRTLQHAACSASNQHQDCSMKVVLSHFTSVKILHRSAKIFGHLRSQQCRHQTGHRTWTSAQHYITLHHTCHRVTVTVSSSPCIFALKGNVRMTPCFGLGTFIEMDKNNFELHNSWQCQKPIVVKLQHTTNNQAICAFSQFIKTQS